MSPSSPFNRRRFLAATSMAAAGMAISSTAHSATAPPSQAPNAGPAVDLHWLDGQPAASTGATFGLPWPRGEITTSTAFALTGDNGVAVPVQTWPLAYWPDGTLKWTGHAIGADPASAAYHLAPGTPTAPGQPVTASRTGNEITLANGILDVRIAANGPIAIKSITRAGRLTAHDGQLVLLLQDKPEDEDNPRRIEWTGTVDSAAIEQSGPVRAVVRLSGHYRCGPRAILPWTLRIYLSANDESLRIVHHFLWDADPNADFIRGLGVRFAVPMTDETHNRHVRFGTASGGVWGEPVRVLTGLRRDPGADVRTAQVAGTATPPVSQWASTVQAGYQQLAQWNDFTLFQGSPDHFAIWKRTSSAGSWLKHAGQGDRATGFGYVGGVSGGLGFGLTDFWQRFPRGLDIRAAATDTATVTLWSWSPLGGAMDLRHYDTVGHGLDLAYEDVQPGFSTPQGMARSTEMRLWAFPATPSRDTITALAATLTAPPQLVAAPAWYHGAGVFGRWSLPDRSTPARAALEDSISRDVAFYAGQVDERQWYGFWHYGDVMHTYDTDRHTWRYDVGGFAWDNAELGTDAMLWYSFLRTGDPATFRLARAMTQHVSEADMHHAGRFAGLGSRHNVMHWGDGAKEARVSESFTKRFAYYLTADELLGDLIRTSLQADQTLIAIDPLREVLPPQHIAPARIRIGPDWYALVSNWLTEWERTGDTRWRDRIVTGMQDIATFPAGLFTGAAGGAVGFDPATAHVVNFNSGDFDGGYNLAMPFLGEQILWETLDLVDVPAFRQTYLDFARYVQAPSAEKIARYGRDFNPQVFPTIYSRVTAWAGEQLNEPAIRQRGWQQFLTDPAGKPWPAAVKVTGNAVPEPVDEIPVASVADKAVATNDMAQRNLAIIALLAVAPEEGP
ncbi:MAG TPA: hypothetical protein VJ914_09295 [Pseudonocardiaceae bacterium]|nr:hypothetical protein [Pseudonocardiaceae bacterium]